MTKTFNILQKVRKRWEMEETALIWRWLPAGRPAPRLLRSLAMTSLGTCRFRRDAGTNLRAPPTRVIARRPKADAAISSRHLRLRRGFPVLRPVLRDCRALLRKARNDKLGCLSHSEGRSAELASAALPCHSEERSDVGISNRHLRIRQGPAVPALTAVYRITKPGHVLRRVPVLCAYCSAYFFV